MKEPSALVQFNVLKGEKERKEGRKKERKKEKIKKGTKKERQ
jgi:hypothetical protein